MMKLPKELTCTMTPKGIILLLVFCSCISLSSSQLENAILIPNGRVAFFLNNDFIFICHSSMIYHNITEIEWFINETSISDFFTRSVTNLTVHTNLTQGSSQLLLHDLSSSFNTTTFQCMITFDAYQTSLTTAALLLIQGLLSQVGSLNATLRGSVIILTWTPPFSLDVISDSHSITYCVQVVNNAEHNKIMQEVCGIEELQFSTRLFLSQIACNSYTFTVIPRNLAGDGERRMVQIIPNLNVIDFEGTIIDNCLNTVKLSIIMPTPLCRCSMAIINSTGHAILTFSNEDFEISFNDSMYIHSVQLRKDTIVEQNEISTLWNISNIGGTESIAYVFAIESTSSDNITTPTYPATIYVTADTAYIVMITILSVLVVSLTIIIIICHFSRKKIKRMKIEMEKVSLSEASRKANLEEKLRSAESRVRETEELCRTICEQATAKVDHS